MRIALWYRGRTRQRFLPAALIVVLFLVVLVTTSGCASGPAVPPAVIATLRANITRDYPDWTIERIAVYRYTGFSTAASGSDITVLLKWKGAEDIREDLQFHYDQSVYYAGYDDLLRQRGQAEAFIRAFKQRHPQAGLGVSGPLYPGYYTPDRGPSAFEDVSYFSASEITSDSPPPHLVKEWWTVTKTPTTLSWVPASGPSPE